MTLKLAVLISGRGTNLTALLRAIDSGSCDATVAIVVSDRSEALGLEIARARGIETDVVLLRDHPDRGSFSEALARCVARVQPDLVVLAGFMRLLGPAFINRFPQRVINVHPSLLPLFPGTTGPKQALAAGVRLTGCTVHLVDTGVDSGAIIAQAAVPVVAGDDAATLHQRIQRAEHVLLPRVIAAISAGDIELTPELILHTPPHADGWLMSLPEPQVE